MPDDNPIAYLTPACVNSPAGRQVPVRHIHAPSTVEEELPLCAALCIHAQIQTFDLAHMWRQYCWTQSRVVHAPRVHHSLLIDGRI